MTPQDLRHRVERRKGERDHVLRELDREQARTLEIQSYAKDVEDAQAVLQFVAQQTQQELEYRIGELVALALSTVFEEDPYGFAVRFEIRRGKTECDLLFVRNGEYLNPMDSSGGGAVDVASFALRVALWSMQPRRSRPVIILDEPFRFINSQEMRLRAGGLLNRVAGELGLQIICVAQWPELYEGAAQVFESRLHRGVTEIKKIGGQE